MPESYLLKGLLVGLVFGVPAGAIGALTIGRTLAHGFRAGLATGLGSSAADSLYALIGVCGLTAVSDLLLAHQTGMCMAGCVLLAACGVRMLAAKEPVPAATDRQARLPLCFGSSFVLALANPATILSFLVAFAAFGITGRLTPGQGAQLIAGVLIGTGGWWALLSGLVAAFRGRVTKNMHRKLNQVLGGLMILLGAILWIRNV